MRSIIDKTEVVALEYLTGLGFEREQVLPLIAQARKDLENEFIKLDAIRQSPNPEEEALDRSLHAIKGLLFNLGHHDLAEKLEAIRGAEDMEHMLADLDRVLAEAEA